MTTHRVLPAEWAPQAAVLLTWPHEDGDWGNNLPAVEENFVAITSAIAKFQTVLISCQSSALKSRVCLRLLSAGVAENRFRIAVAASNDVWARDHGPVTVLDEGRPSLLDFRFNGWGGKYPSGLDNEVTKTLHSQGVFGPARLTSVDCVLEGGAIESNGEGVLLTTTHCLPLPSRNPDMSPPDFDRLFEEHFGVHTVHWLQNGHLAGDDTDGHIDTLARFCSPDAIVFQDCDDTDDEHFEALKAMREELESLRRPDKQPYQLHALPLPSPVYDEDGHRLPAGYANFLIINGAVLMPAYGDPLDSVAATVLATCFSDREIIQIDCRALIRQYGSLHCVTMQIPAQVELTQA